MWYEPKMFIRYFVKLFRTSIPRTLSKFNDYIHGSFTCMGTLLLLKKKRGAQASVTGTHIHTHTILNV